MTHTLSGKPCTAKAYRDFLIHYARVMLREVRARRGSKGNEWMLLGAARARREAAAIDLKPAQLTLEIDAAGQPIRRIG